MAKLASEAQSLPRTRVISTAAFRSPYRLLGHHSQSQMLPKGQLASF